MGKEKQLHNEEFKLMVIKVLIELRRRTDENRTSAD